MGGIRRRGRDREGGATKMGVGMRETERRCNLSEGVSGQKRRRVAKKRAMDILFDPHSKLRIPVRHTRAHTHGHKERERDWKK